jgi:hypothetical protein
MKGIVEKTKRLLSSFFFFQTNKPNKRSRLIMSFKSVMFKAGMKLKKHSPAIFTGIGIVGLGATAYLAYKSRDKVEVVVEEIERQRDLEIPVNKMEVAKGLTEALYQPVVVGAASVACILMAQKIQNNRIKMLVGTLALEQARNVYFERKYKEQHGEEAYTKFVTPTEDVEHTEIDKKGKEKTTITQVKKEIDQTIGQWFDESQLYVSDDHSYNIAQIDKAREDMLTLMFHRGHVILNEVREALGFERIKNGALLGWSTADSFDIEKNVVIIEENGELKEQIWVTWSRPRYVYDEVELGGGRYSPFEI